MKSLKIAFLGAGNMAEALISGVLQGNGAQPKDIFATDISSSRLDKLEKGFHVRVGSSNCEAVQWAEVIILCVKPQVMKEVACEIRNSLSPTQLVISVAAGYPMSRIREHVGQDIPLVRAMPNTPAVIQEGVTALAGSEGISPKFVEISQHIFESVGTVVMVEEKTHGCGDGTQWQWTCVYLSND